MCGFKRCGIVAAANKGVSFAIPGRVAKIFAEFGALFSYNQSEFTNECSSTKLQRATNSQPLDLR